MGTPYHLIKRVVLRLLEIPQRGLPQLRPNRSRFDEEWGTETEKLVWLTNPSSKNFVHGVRYEACSPNACRWAIETAKLDYAQFHFIDVGSGKGRPLLIASRYPFAHLTGIEYSAQLCREAQGNLQAAAIPLERFTIHCADAADFDFVEHDSLVYFHNPFDSEVLRPVMDKLHRLAQTHRLFIAYEGPRREHLAEYQWLRHHSSGPNVSLYTAGEISVSSASDSNSSTR